MALDKIPVQKVAKLANLKLSEEELAKYSKQLSKIVDYISDLESVDTNGIEPIYNISPKMLPDKSKNILAEDKIKESLPQEDVLKNGQVEAGFFVTEGVFKDE